MSKQVYRLINDEVVQNCLSLISQWWQPQHAAGKTLVVEIRRVNRSLEQNRRYWAMLGDISKQIRVLGKCYSPEVWHEHLKREIIGLEPLPNGGVKAKSSKGLSVDEFANYMTMVEVWAAEQNVIFSERYL